MTIKLLIASILCPVAGCLAQSITPSVINVAGGFSKKDQVQLEWSVGEMALVQQMDARQNNTIVTNGFLQPYLVNPGNTSIVALFEPNEVKIFPNPATQFVEVNFFTRQKGKFNFNLYDAAGKLVFTEDVPSYGVDLILRIPVTHLASGTYMLHINLASPSGFLSKSGAYKIITIR